MRTAANMRRTGMKTCINRKSGKSLKEDSMAKNIRIEHNEDGSWRAFSPDGSEIRFGHAEGLFNPGDLMKIALAGCAALSSQSAIQRTLGTNDTTSITVDGEFDGDSNSYVSFQEHISVDASAADLSGEDVEKFEEQIRRHIDKACTVAHTYHRETPTELTVDIKSK